LERDELAAWLRLTLTPGVGNATARKLLAAFGLPQAVFAQTEQSALPIWSARNRPAALQDAATRA
jgi:DNA processing protein